MDFLTNLGSLGGSTFGYIVPFLFVLSVIVFFHELGHFAVGRWCGVRVLAFSLGFGPELFAFNDRHGTRWRIAAIPLGGYVKFFGDANAASMPDTERNALMTPEERAVSFFHKPVWQRAAIVAAGPIANFLLAIAIFTAIFSIYGKQTVTPVVQSVVASSPAEKAGIKAGDVIVSVDGHKIGAFSDIQALVVPSAGKALQIEIRRDGGNATLAVTPEATPGTDETGRTITRGTIGVHGTLQPEPLPRALWLGTQQTGEIIGQTLGFLSRLVVGRESTKSLGGPIKIATMSNQVFVSSGLIGLIQLAAFLSVSVGLLNLFPIPLLDGGHLVFYAVEAVQGRPLRERTQEMLFRVGFALVVMLMVFSFVNDIHNPFQG